MKGDILYKGKYGNRWIEGWYVILNSSILNKKNCCHKICTPTSHMYDIDPNTLCKYTGFNDDTGSKIWTNDILYVAESKCSACYNEYGMLNIDTSIWKSRYYFIVDDRPSCFMNVQRFSNSDSIYCKVVGNKFDDKILYNKLYDIYFK